MKIIVITLLLAIVTSLAFGLYYLRYDAAGSPRLLKALKIRVTLSAALILFLVASYYFGWIVPNSA